MTERKTQFEAVCDGGQKFYITANGEYGRTKEDYLVRREAGNTWKVIDLGVIVKAIETAPLLSLK